MGDCRIVATWGWPIALAEDLSQYAVLALATYILGSVPFAYLWTRVFAHADLRRVGTGNASIYSSFFNGGYRPAVMTFASNCAVGLLAVHLSHTFLPGDRTALMVGIVGAAVGALWPLFTRFRGGSRGTTVVGWSAFFLDFYLGRAFPVIPAITLGIWAIALLSRRRTFFATSVTYRLFPFVFGIVDQSWEVFIGAAVLSVLLQLKHQEKYDDSTLYGVGRRIGVNKR